MQKNTEAPKDIMPKDKNNGPERLKKAQILAWQKIMDAYSLYDPQIDGYDRAWLEIVSLAACYDEYNVFNLRKAFDLAIICAISKENIKFTYDTLGYLARHHARNSQKHDAALFWYEKELHVKDRAHFAARKIAEIFIEYDQRFQTENAGVIFDDVMAKLDYAITQKDSFACLLKGIVLLLGKGIKKNSERGLSFLERSIEIAFENGYPDLDREIYASLYPMLMQHINEADPSAPLTKAFAIYEKYKVSLKEEQQAEWDKFFTIGFQDPYRKLVILCAQFNQGIIKRKTLEKYMHPFLGTEHDQKMLSVLCFFRAARLYCAPRSTKIKSWTELLHFIENSQRCISKEQLIKSTQDCGPRYNPLNSQGLTILGVWERAATNDDKSHESSYVPTGGIQSLEAINTDENGIIYYKTKNDQTLPAKLLPEDFDVALALIFGDVKSPILPHFDLPYIKIEENEVRSSMHEKIWNPEWLHQTDLGRSLYAADKLTGDIAFSPLQMPVGTSSDSVTPETPRFAKKFLSNLFNTSGKISAHHQKRVMLVPENVDLDVSYEENGAKKTIFRVENIKIKMRIDGEEVDLLEKGSSSLNDTYYNFPRLTQDMTDQYETLKLYAPLFKRAEEISKLINALYALRVAGYMLPPVLQQQVTQNLAQYQSVKPLEKKDLLCRPHNEI